MFHFPAFPPHCLCVQQRVTAHDDCRVSPFGHPRINALLATPRGLSRPYTSFIGSLCQGIHRAPFTDNTHKQSGLYGYTTNKITLNKKNKEYSTPTTHKHTVRSHAASKDTRVHYTVLKQHEPHTHTQPTSHARSWESHSKEQHKPFQTPNNVTNQEQTTIHNQQTLIIHHTNPTPIVGHGS